MASEEPLRPSRPPFAVLQRFKSPVLVKPLVVAAASHAETPDAAATPPAENDSAAPPTGPPPTHAAVAAPPVPSVAPFKPPTRLPFLAPARTVPVSSSGASRPPGAGPAAAGPDTTLYFQVYYTKRSTKKHKTFSLDGVLACKPCPGTNATLYSLDGRVASQGRVAGATELGEGSHRDIGGWELEISGPLPAADFLAGKCFDTRPARPSTCPHDPAAPNAVVLAPSRGPLPPVVLDPYLAKQLRPHQVEGVRFLYECATGMRQGGHTGCILADAMGLGKTLQVIAFLWTAFHQGGPGGGALARHGLVVCPASLVANWGAECRKWLGPARLKPLLVQGTAAAAAATVADFCSPGQSISPLLVLSYDAVRLYAPVLARLSPTVLVCDEAHRLKATGGSRTAAALATLAAPIRLLLTGTPVQNDLDELRVLADTACPGLLPPAAHFRRVYSLPISRGRERDATSAEVGLGRERASALAAIVAPYLLRRGAEVTKGWLPPRTRLAVFCAPSGLQAALYRAYLSSPEIAAMLSGASGGGGGGGGAVALTALAHLTAICHHPAIFRARAEAASHNANDAGGPAAAALRDAWPTDSGLADVDVGCTGVNHSGKGRALMAMLASSLDGGGAPGDDSTDAVDRWVVVSESAAVLDWLQGECGRRGWAACRLDGTTPMTARQPLVDSFNAGRAGRLMLLSKLAGGVGLNLVGANRLCLWDTAWNPAHDKQAGGRVWRSGQRKAVVEYRLLTAGALDEKMYQRQLSKDGIDAGMRAAAGAQIQTKATGPQFTRDELKALFRLDASTGCGTRDLLSRGGAGEAWVDAAKSASAVDAPLAAAIAAGGVTFVRRVPEDDDGAECEGGDAGAEVSEGGRGDSDRPRDASSDDDGGGGGKRARRGVVLDDDDD